MNELNEILKTPTSIDKIHQSVFRNSYILVYVLKMIERGDTKETILEVVDFLTSSNTFEAESTNKPGIKDSGIPER